jgi:hypothetical protein
MLESWGCGRIGRKLRAAVSACSSLSIESQPVFMFTPLQVATYADPLIDR